MGIWDFFQRRKKKKGEEDSLPFSGEELEAPEDIKGLMEESEAGRAQGLCQRLAEASRQVEEAKVEYSAVTGYLADIQKIDLISGEGREMLDSAARDIITCSKEREKYRDDGIRLSAKDRQTMERYQGEMAEELKKMHEKEAYQKVVERDLNYLEKEKGHLKRQRVEIVKKQEYLQKIAVVISALSVVLFALLFALSKVFRADMTFPFILTVFMAAASAASIVLEANKNRANMALTEKKLNKAIGLLNKVKIKYINSASVLDYTYEKYGVGSAMELEQIWQQYEELKRRERQYRNNAARLNDSNEKLVAQLESYGVEDAGIWIYQPAAILDKKEMVEIRHRLNVRRQKLRDRIDYNNKVKLEALEELKEVLEQMPELKEEVLRGLDGCKIEI